MNADSEQPETAISLVPIPRDDFNRWRERTVIDYAAEKVTSGAWLPEGSVERAEAEFRDLLPDGSATPEHHVWSVRGPGGAHIGVVWVGPRLPRMPGALYIWDISIEPEWRGRGYGRAAIEALHAWARAAGFERIGLHVFGWNEAARRLYRRTGYVETDVNMEKRL